MIWFCLLNAHIGKPSFPCARQFGVIMHSGMKGGATYITDSQPVINNLV